MPKHFVFRAEHPAMKSLVYIFWCTVPSTQYILQTLKETIIVGVLLRINWGRAKAQRSVRLVGGRLGSLFLWLLENTPHPRATSLMLSGPAQTSWIKCRNVIYRTKMCCRGKDTHPVTVKPANLNSAKLASGRNSLIFLQLDVVTFLGKADVD